MNKPIRISLTIFVLCIAVLCLCAFDMHQNCAAAETVYANVIDIEHFGHAVLDISAADFSAAGYTLGDIVRIRFGDYEADMPFFNGYYTNPGEVLLRGLTPEENIAVCINYGNFSAETGISLGETVEITLTEKAGMLALQELYALNYSLDRADYSSDAVFANFREVTSGDIGSGKLYRSASPIDNIYGRAHYADQLIASADITTVLNLADSDEDIAEHCTSGDFDSPYYLSLCESGKVAAVNLGANFFSDEFAATIAEGLTFLAQNDPPYCIHCTEGKDRAGFTAMLLEALMGADLQKIIDDYMISFRNYYGIDQESEPDRYQAILDINLMEMLFHVTGVQTRAQLAEINLQAAASQYLLRAGMAEEDILSLQQKLQ